MTKITIDRSTVEQALEALEAGPDVDPIFAGETEDALRAALAEPVLNPAPGYCKHCKQYTIEKPLPAEPVQEPVAYIHRQGNYWDTSERHLTDDEKARGWTEEPLYTAPPQRKPLKKEQLLYIYNQLPNWGMDMDRLPQGLEKFARAVEQAHGI